MEIFNFNYKYDEIKDAVIIHNTAYMYGLGCFFTSQKAKEKIIHLKNRQKKGFILLVPDVTNLESFTLDLSLPQKKLITKLSPGNVTFIIKANDEIPDFLKIEGFAAFRIPESFTLRKFILKYKTPFISTSINKSGETAINDLKKIDSLFGEKVDFILPIPNIEKKEISPSTIVKLFEDKIELIRSGNVDFSSIEKDFKNLKEREKSAVVPSLG